MKEPIVELLAPAATFDSVKGAIYAGADAVYIGGSSFGARAYADNPTDSGLFEIMDFVHLHGKKLYLTVNTLLKQTELENELISYLTPFYENGLDAVIVQDIGVLSIIHDNFPDLPIHASTQMTITGQYGADYLKQYHVKRIVTARELSLEEIKEIHEHTDMEIESFIHGALCYSYSGQCLMSSFIGGRSGNRGRCAQPCRLPYSLSAQDGQKMSDTCHLLSPKDMCTLSILPEIIQSGVYSMKIEGRMKRPEYAAGVTAVYRKYIDLFLEKGASAYSVSQNDIDLLKDLFNRGGFCTGYYDDYNEKKMMYMKRPNHYGLEAGVVQASGSSHRLFFHASIDISKEDILELRPKGRESVTFSLDTDVKTGDKVLYNIKKGPSGFDKTAHDCGPVFRVKNDSLLNRLKEKYIDCKKPLQIAGTAQISVGQPMVLSVTYQNTSVTIEGEAAEPAQNKPASEDQIVKQLTKTGETMFSFSKLAVKINGDCFIPVRQLNDLRRRALDELQNKLLSGFRRQPRTISSNYFHQSNNKFTADEKPCELSVFLENVSILQQLCSFPEITNFYLSSIALDFSSAETISHAIECLASCADKCHQAGKKLFLSLPEIFRRKTAVKYEKLMPKAQNYLDGIVIHNIDELQFVRTNNLHQKLLIVADYSLYSMNSNAAKQYCMDGCSKITFPVELNRQELATLSSDCVTRELIVYGYLPVMTSTQCPVKNTAGCSKTKSIYFLKDRTRKNFPCKNNCDECYNIIYNVEPLALYGMKKELENIRPDSLCLRFTKESEREAIDITKAYIQYFFKNRQGENPSDSFTRGHFKRGVE